MDDDEIDVTIPIFIDPIEELGMASVRRPSYLADAKRFDDNALSLIILYLFQSLIRWIVDWDFVCVSVSRKQSIS